MKSIHLAIASALAAAACLSGCALDPSIPQRATASAVGNNALAPEQVVVSDGHLDVVGGSPIYRWHASSPSGEFDCSGVMGDGVLKQPVCVRK